MFLGFHDNFRLAVLINSVLIKKLYLKLWSLCIEMSSFLFVRAWAMLCSLYLSCEIQFLVWTTDNISSLKSVVVRLSRKKSGIILISGVGQKRIWTGGTIFEVVSIFWVVLNFEVIFIFEFIFIHEVVFILEVRFIFVQRLRSFPWT